MIPPDVLEERVISVDHLKPAYYPLCFNLHLDGKKSSHIVGLTYKEAKEVLKKLSKAIREMMKNENKRAK